MGVLDRYGKVPKRSKYGNRAVEVDGLRFDSQKEAYRWQELKLLERTGAIKDLQRQVPFEIIPAQYDDKGKLAERKTVYIADFVYVENGEMVVEDTKGVRTDVYKLKKKLMRHVYGIEVKEV